MAMRTIPLLRVVWSQVQDRTVVGQKRLQRRWAGRCVVGAGGGHHSAHASFYTGHCLDRDRKSEVGAEDAVNCDAQRSASKQNSTPRRLWSGSAAGAVVTPREAPCSPAP